MLGVSPPPSQLLIVPRKRISQCAFCCIWHQWQGFKYQFWFYQMLTQGDHKNVHTCVVSFRSLLVRIFTYTCVTALFSPISCKKMYYLARTYIGGFSITRLSNVKLILANVALTKLDDSIYVDAITKFAC